MSRDAFSVGYIIDTIPAHCEEIIVIGKKYGPKVGSPLTKHKSKYLIPP